MHRSGRATDEGATKKTSDTYWELFRDQYKVFAPCLKSGLHLEKNLLAEALSFAEEAVNASSGGADVGTEFIFSAHMHLAAAHHALGNLSQAMEIVCDAKAKLDEMGASHLNHNLMAYQALLRLWDGDSVAAREWLDNYFVTKFDRLPSFKLFQHFTTARAYMVLGDVDEAMTCVLELAQYSTDFRHTIDVAEADTLKAAIEWALGKHKQAAATLEGALATLQPHGFMRIVANEGAAIEPILKRIVAMVSSDEYDGLLKRDFVLDTFVIAHGVAKKHKGIAAHIKNAKSDKPIKLSKQQRKVLQLLTAGHNNQKISEIMGLTVHTVKLHLSQAYKKLGVHSGLDAVVKVKELGLLG
jgi:LuxR family maltose regulon positive regulatory protein